MRAVVMQPMLQYAQQAALAFLQTGDANDEYFLVDSTISPM